MSFQILTYSYIIIVLSLTMLWFLGPMSKYHPNYHGHVDTKSNPMPKKIIKENIVKKQPKSHIPFRSDGVVFVSNAFNGPIRESLEKLRKTGYHILVGVKNNMERNSFSYSLGKGLEFIDFNIGDPSTYPDLIYRLRVIQRDLDRPIAGIVLNLADEVYDSLTLNHKYLDVNYVEEYYRKIFKSPIRLVQTIYELAKIQKNEAEGIVDPEEETIQSNTNTFYKAKGKEVFLEPTNGFRLTLVTANATSDSKLSYIMQNNVIDYFKLLQSHSPNSNFSLSLVSTSKVEDNNIQDSFSAIPWVVEDDATTKPSDESRYIFHSLTSKIPKDQYF